MNKRIIAYLNLSRFLIAGLIISQIVMFSILNGIIEEKKDAELSERICIEELIPLEPIKELN